jgi:hypothetical protein
MARYQFIFWIPNMGSETITMIVKPGNLADDVARSAISAALRGFNSRWPGNSHTDICLVRARYGI